MLLDRDTGVLMAIENSYVIKLVQLECGYGLCVSVGIFLWDIGILSRSGNVWGEVSACTRGFFNV